MCGLQVIRLTLTYKLKQILDPDEGSRCAYNCCALICARTGICMYADVCLARRESASVVLVLGLGVCVYSMSSVKHTLDLANYEANLIRCYLPSCS